MWRVAGILVLLLAVLGRGTAEGEIDDRTSGPASGAFTVSVSETPDAVQLRIRARRDVEPGSVEVRFAGRKAVVLARDTEGRPVRSRALRLPERVIEEGPTAEYDTDDALVVTLRKQVAAGDLRRPPRPLSATR